MKSIPKIIAITGGSGSGKSWLADRLLEHFGVRAARVSLDDFYRDRSHLAPARRLRVNYDRPEAIDWKLFQTWLRGCRNGVIGPVPRYDFKTHTRMPSPSESRASVLECGAPAPLSRAHSERFHRSGFESQESYKSGAGAPHSKTSQDIESVPALIFIEGLWLLRRPTIRQLIDLSIFIDCPEDVMVGIYTRAVGLDFLSFVADGDVFGVRYQGLPDTLPRIVPPR